MKTLSTTPVILLLAQAIIFSGNAFAQACNNKEVAQTISAKNFIFTDVVDNAGAPGSIAFDNSPTKLTWQRCVYGQKWNPATQECIGSPVLLSWSQALIEAERSTIDGTGWRLPNIKELNSILDMQCINPPYNLEVFPDTFASEDHGLWTSSPHVDTEPDPVNTQIKVYTNAWYIDLGVGILSHRSTIGDGIDDIKTKNFARFVR